MELDKLEEKIIYFLMRQSEPVTVAKLADLCNVSSNSIRNRLPGLNEKIREENLVIVMKRSVGCTLKKLHEDTENEAFMNTLKFDINRAQYVSKQSRCDFIIRRLLCVSRHVTTVELCDSLYYSYSELHRDIAKANKWLVPFHLEIVTHRNKGLVLEGSEFHKRVCMIFQHKRFRYLNDGSKKNEPWFEAVFNTGISTESVNEILSGILKDFPGYTYSHLNTPKISNMLYVMKARQNYADEIAFSDEDQSFLKSTPGYQIAMRFCEAAGPYFHYHPSEADLYCMTAVIECYRSVRTYEDIAFVPYVDGVYREAADSLHELAHVCFNDLIDYEEADIRTFACKLFTIKILLHFKLPLDTESIFPLRHNDATGADFSVAYYHIFKKHNQEILHRSLMRYLAYTFRTHVKKLKIFGGDIRILLYSIYGYEYASYAADTISQVYNREIHSAKAIEYMPDMVPFNHEGDLLLTDTSNRNLKTSMVDSSQIPVIWLPLINRPKRLDDLDEWLTKKKIETLQAITVDRIHHSSCTGVMDVYEKMYEYLHGEIHMSKEEFIASLEEREHIFPANRDNKIAFVALSKMSKDADVLEVLINKKNVSWRDFKIQFFVFYNYTCMNIPNMYGIIMFLRYFVRQTPEVLLSLVEKKSSDIVEFIMSEGMKMDISGH